MSKFDVYTTKKGTELPLMNLKGKPYMQVAQRLVWFTEEAESYSIETSFPLLTSEETVAHVVVKVFDKSNALVKSASATKREDKKSFADHTEKAETGAIGRALAMLGFGTQFAIADLEEGDRLADSPIAVVTKAASLAESLSQPVTTGPAFVAAKKTSFSKKVLTQSGDDI